MDTGGRFRWLTKPFKRWAFAQGVGFTNKWRWHFACKYIGKVLQYIDKHEVEGKVISSDTKSRHLAAQLTNVLMPAVAAKSGVPVLPKRAALEEAIAAALESEQARITLGPGADVAPSLTHRTAASRSTDQHSTRKLVVDLAEYAEGLGKAPSTLIPEPPPPPPEQTTRILTPDCKPSTLYQAIDANRGLDHSKVRARQGPVVDCREKSCVQCPLQQITRPA